MTKLFKKGEKIVRIYGSNSWGRYDSMRPGDVGTVSEDQKYPGIVKFKEWPGDHDPMRLRRLKDLKGLTAKEAAALWQAVQDQNFDEVLKFFKRGK